MPKPQQTCESLYPSRRARGNILYLPNGKRALDLDINQGWLPLGHRPLCLRKAHNWLSRHGVYIPGLYETLCQRYFLSAFNIDWRDYIINFEGASQSLQQDNLRLIQIIENDTHNIEGIKLGPSLFAGWPIYATLERLSKDEVSSKPHKSIHEKKSIYPMVIHGLIEGLSIIKFLRRSRKTYIGWANLHGLLSCVETPTPISHVSIPTAILNDQFIKNKDIHVHSAKNPDNKEMQDLYLPLILERGSFSFLESLLRRIEIPAPTPGKPGATPPLVA